MLDVARWQFDPTFRMFRRPSIALRRPPMAPTWLPSGHLWSHRLRRRNGKTRSGMRLTRYRTTCAASGGCLGGNYPRRTRSPTAGSALSSTLSNSDWRGTSRDNPGAVAVIFLSAFSPYAFDHSMGAVEFEDDDPGATGEAEPVCELCGASIGIFLERGLAWLHYSGDGTTAGAPAHLRPRPDSHGHLAPLRRPASAVVPVGPPWCPTRILAGHHRHV